MENKRILVVDDNSSLHEDFRKILVGTRSAAAERMEGVAQELFGSVNKSVSLKNDYELDFAFQGEEAFHKVIGAYEQKRPYALIFMDIRMPPGWDGITTIEKIWAKVPQTEIVVCTAYSDYSLDEVILKLGKSERLLFLKKPFDSVEVLQIAIAQTKKWNLEQANIKYTENLEKLVEERTLQRDNEHAININGAKLMALGEMAAGIAHEINNPLAIIGQNASLLEELLADGLEKEMGQKIAKKIVSTTERVAKIIKGLKAFSRSGNEDPYDNTPTSAFIEEILGICQERFKQQGVEILVDNSFSLVTVECRKVQILQVFLNLLNNSYDAIEKASTKWVQIKVVEFPEYVIFVLTDSGSGIPQQVRDRIFKPFFTTKEVGKGTGLGLSISKSIIEAHNGTLEIDALCKNTCFVISLPKKHHNKILLEKVG